MISCVEVSAATPAADLFDASGKPVDRQSMTDMLINAEVLLPQGEKMQMAKVVRRTVDENGKVNKVENSSKPPNSPKPPLQHLTNAE